MQNLATYNNPVQVITVKAERTQTDFSRPILIGSHADIISAD